MKNNSNTISFNFKEFDEEYIWILRWHKGGICAQLYNWFQTLAYDW